MSKEIVSKVNTRYKYVNLVLSLLCDAIGMLTYLVPFFGEFADVVWAPIAGLILIKMYKGTVGAVGSIIVFFEELLPGLDFIPTFTLTWLYTYYIHKPKEIASS